MPAAIDAQWADSIASALDDAFCGRFDTDTYPDSWLWQEGTGKEGVPKQMVNAWKCSKRIAALVTAQAIAQMACFLMGWSGARLAADSVWMKPPRWREGGYHQDEMDIFGPADLITCWVALSDMSVSNGSLNYARGSHTWRRDMVLLDRTAGGDRPREFVARLAATQDIAVEFCSVEAVKGSISFHHGRTWHGTTANETDSWRSAIGIHLIRSDAQFAKMSGGHVLGRYKLTGTLDLDENFFPIVHGAQPPRSAFIDAYCVDGERG